MPIKKRSPIEGTQSERFIETARKLECDESEERFDEALKKVAGHPHKAKPKPKKDE